MKVCHMTSAHKSDDIRIFKKQCISLAKFGYDVNLVACGESRIENNVNIIGTGKQHKRLARMILDAYSVYKLSLKVDAAIYHIHDPELLPYALKLKKRGKIVIFDSHEDVVMQIKEKDYLPKWICSLISYLYAIYESHILNKINAVVSVSPIITERLSHINPNTYMITNYPIFVEHELTILKKNQICFTGGINSEWQHSIILDALDDIQIKYIICGVTDENYLEKLKKHRNWEKVEYLGKISHSEVLKLQSESICGMAILDYLLNAGGTVGTLGNTKIFEYMMAGIPVICTDFKLWKEIVEDKAGICVNPHNPQQIHKALLTLLDNPNKGKELGVNGFNLIKERYNWESQEKILLEMYSSLSNH